jgi:hypothetical protein
MSAGNNSAESKPKGPAFTSPPGPPQFVRELHKFVGQQVEVEYMLGEERCQIEGKLVAWDTRALHCVIDTSSESYIVRLPLQVTRSRKHGKQVTEPAK